MKRLILWCAILSAAVPLRAVIINVPADQPTIQDAIVAAENGDIIMVAPGTYYENINFMGKAIRVESSKGSKVTVIDGGQIDSVVTFDNGEGLESMLHGFTIQNGNASFQGGGVLISDASPTIMGNIVTNNTACGDGGGIALYFSSALVESNTVSNNAESADCVGFTGAGISVIGAGSAQIIGNLIENNITTSGDGGGIELNGAGTPTLENNIIRGNVAKGISPASQGGGIVIGNVTNALIVQNLIYDNVAVGQGSGIYFGVVEGTRGPLLVNNTIVGTKSSPQGAAVYASGYADQVQFFNNLMIGPQGTNAVFCDSTFDQTPPTFTNNDAYSPDGSGLQGTCGGQSGVDGNISVNPTFVSKGNFRLQEGSPAIGTGDSSAPDLPPLDLAGNPRIVDGKVDMGAYESQTSAEENVTPAQP
jgi:parallel beta-helix repeat protein